MSTRMNPTPKLIRRATAALATAGLAFAGLLAASAPAEAATYGKAGTVVKQCTGIKKQSWTLPGTKATLQYWYSTKNGGTSCAMVYDNVSGKNTMYVSLRPKTGQGSFDYGLYEYYAGGAQLTNTKGKCVYVYADISKTRYSKVLGFKSATICNK
ncbi:hypothetical protein [Arthrobacter sp. NPDC090010]|uniref:hypothetical protein n=1 Tax=Arthrobacter sp. NPDC090010 TaxID=3363942 RepID=UPI00382B7D70